MKTFFLNQRPQKLFFTFSSICLLILPVAADNLQWLAGGHAGDVTAVAYSPDGQVVASASDDSSVKFWSTDGTLLWTLDVHPCQATSLAFSPDGTKLAIGTYHGPAFGSGEGDVILWESAGGWTSNAVSLVRTSTLHMGKVGAVAFSVDSTRLASGGAEGTNVVQQVSNGAVLDRLRAHTSTDDSVVVLSLAYSSAGLLASGCEDGTLRVWNAAGSQQFNSTSAHGTNITSVAFSTDGSLLVSGGLDGTAVLRSASSWSAIRTFSGHLEGVTAVAFSPDSSKVGTGSYDTTAMLWNVSSGSRLSTLSGHSDAVLSVAFSPDSNSVVTGSRDNTAAIWDADTGLAVLDLCPLTGSVRITACSPDGSVVATASNDRKINLWDSADGTLLDTFERHTNWVSTLAFSPDSTTLASGGDALLLWDISSSAITGTIPVGSNGVTSVAFSPDGTVLASGGDAADQVIELWDPATGSLIRTLDGHSNGVTVLEFSPDGTMLASGGRRFDNNVKLWNPATGLLIDSFSGVSDNVEVLAFSPDGGAIAAVGNGNSEIHLWDVSTGAQQTFGSGTVPVFGLAFSPDGATLAASDEDSINFWDVATGTMSQIWISESEHVSSFAYSPNGNYFTYSREDAVVAVADNPWSVLGQPPLLFSSIDVQPGETTLQAEGEPQVTYLIETSDNLQDWVPIATVKGDSGLFEVIDAAGGDKQFYRAVTPR